PNRRRTARPSRQRERRWTRRDRLLNDPLNREWYSRGGRAQRRAAIVERSRLRRVTARRQSRDIEAIRRTGIGVDQIAVDTDFHPPRETAWMGRVRGQLQGGVGGKRWAAGRTGQAHDGRRVAATASVAGSTVEHERRRRIVGTAERAVESDGHGSAAGNAL